MPATDTDRINKNADDIEELRKEQSEMGLALVRIDERTKRIDASSDECAKAQQKAVVEQAATNERLGKIEVHIGYFVTIFKWLLRVTGLGALGLGGYSAVG